MVKLHNCLVEITNGTQFPMTYVLDWYDSGRVADGFTCMTQTIIKQSSAMKETALWQDVQGTLPIT